MEIRRDKYLDLLIHSCGTGFVFSHHLICHYNKIFRGVGIWLFYFANNNISTINNQRRMIDGKILIFNLIHHFIYISNVFFLTF